ncbi:unnamed protein product [Urochloa humidicola]
MAAAGGGCGGDADEPPPPVQYHMSDDEEDKAFYARAYRPPSPTSPGYGPTVPADARAADDGDDDLFFFDDDMVAAAAAAGYSSSSDDDAWPDRMCEYEDDPPDPAGARRQAERYAGYALEHYNADPSNGVKYELVEATESNYIFVGYAHVNFVARPRGGGRERLFFAELHRQLERDTMVPTCLRSLDSEGDRVGGLSGEPLEDHAGPDEARYCFACHDALKHPKDGTCYGAGH